MDERSCATCGWGVQWTRSSLDGRLHGRCRFVPSIPLPKVLFPRFGEETPMPTQCQGWAKPKDIELVPRWMEEDLDYILRASRYLDKELEKARLDVASLEAQVIAEDPELAARIGLI